MIFGDKFKKIENWGKKGDLANLGKFVADKDTNVRVAAIKALGEVKGDDVFNMLISSLRDPELSVRISVVESLGKLGDVRAVEYLRHQLGKEQDAAFIQAIQQVMKSTAKN